MTIGRSWILCMPRIATCGGFRIGVDISEPNTPPFVIVNVPPVSSSSVIEPSRALAWRMRRPPDSISREAQ